MDTQKIKEYQARLEKDRVALIENLRKEEKPVDFGSDQDDFEEEANEAESFGYGLAEAQATKERISAIDLALSKIREGNYGVCESCGKEIGGEVLDAAPESRLCRNCKKKG